MKPELAAEQAAVVYARPGDLFVAAGAGSGKTHVLVSRFVAAVMGEGPLEAHRVDEILAVTFTDKAAGELSERVRTTLLKAGREDDARAVEEAWISTIHGMCSRILRRHAFDIGLDPRFTVCTNVQSAVLMQEAFEEAARAALRESSDVEALVLDFGASAVSTAIMTAYGELRSMGRSLDDVALRTGAPYGELAHTVKEFEGLADAFAAFPETQTTAHNATVARETAELLLELTSEPDPLESARTTLGRLGTRRFFKRGSAEVKACAEKGTALLDEAAGVLTHVVCAPYESAFVTLLQRFAIGYDAMKDAQGLLDFEDLQIKTAQLLEEHPDVAAGYRAAFRHVMIDEFQDTNALQLRIARALSDDDLLTVGDDKQSIYRFRHADVSVFKRLEAEARVVQRLRANYRSHADVLGVVNGLFSSDSLFGDDFAHLTPARDEGHAVPWPAEEPRVRMLAVDGHELRGSDAKRDAEARALARHLARLRRDTGVRQGDIAVLVRAMQGRAERIERALRAEGFDAYVASGGTFFARPEIEDLIALLRTIDNPRDDRAFMQVLAGRLTGLSDEALHVLAHLPGRCVWDAVSEASHEYELGDVDEALLARTVAVLEELRTARGRESIAALIHTACERLDYDLALFASGPDGPRAWANVLKVARLAGEFERLSTGDLGAFLDYVAAYRDVSPETQAALAAEGVDAVRVMSIHAAKGLEFPVVAVADLSSTSPNVSSTVLVGRGDDRRIALKLPAAASPDGVSHESAVYSGLRAAEAEADDAEARRLLYVACTRAREALVLCGTVDPAKEAKGPCGLDRLRRASGLEGPMAIGEREVVLRNGHVMTLTVVAGEAAQDPACEPVPETGYDPAAFAQDMRFAASPETRPRTISYTGLAVYEACPYKFYASRIARLRTPEGHRTGPDPRGFGSAVHAVLQSAVDGMPEAERLDAAALANGLDDVERERLEQAVRAYLRSPVAREASRGERTVRECPVAVPLGDTILSGSIDLVSWTGTVATVVDYKTGAGELAPDVARERYKTQAECYALAVLRAGATAASVRFIELERECRETRYEFSLDDARSMETAILATLEKMERGEFPHLTEFSEEACADCPALGGLCPINPRRGASAGADRTRR